MVSGKLPAPNSPPSPGAALEEPPSYDFATTSSSSQAEQAPPEHIQHLFTGPPNPEPLLGRATTPQAVLESIKVSKRGAYLESFDPRLEDPSVLYDFIRHQVLSRPSNLRLRCTGSHWETPTRDETVTDNGGIRHRRKGQAELVIDFNFTIDLSTIMTQNDNLNNITLSTIPPNIPCSRGTHPITYSYAFAPNPLDPAPNPDQVLYHPGKIAPKALIQLRQDWVKYIYLHGLPLWIDMWTYRPFWDSRSGSGLALMGEERAGVDEEEMRLLAGEDLERLKEVKGLKGFCERYGADHGWLKEFHVPFWHYGWDFEAVTIAVRGAIASTGYQSNHLSVEVQPDVLALVVKPANTLSKAVSNTFVRALMWITLIYPIIWLWQRFSEHGGAPYKVARATYSLKSYQPLPSTFPSEPLSSAKDRLPGLYKTHPEIPRGATLQPGPKGIYYLLGRREGEWFREWEERIRMGVRMRYVGELQGGGEEDAGVGLDGY